MPPKRHAKLGASKAERWINCSGSINLEAMLPPGGGSSEYAREGTAAHEVAERCLKEGREPIEFLGEMIDVPETVIVTEKGRKKEKTITYKVKVTEEMCEAVSTFVSHVREVAKGGQLMIEQKFDLSPLNPPDEMYGTSDAVVWKERTKHLTVIDYKHGRGVAVDATENEQLSIYGIGSVLKLGKKPKKITLTIVQPRASHPDGPIRSHEYTYEELVAFKKVLFEAALKTQDPNAPLKVGEWCRFCRAQGICPAQRSHAVAIAQSEFDVIDPTAHLIAPTALTDDQLRNILAAKPTIASWLKAVEEVVLDRLKAGQEFPGYKLVAKRAMRKWKNPDQASKWLEKRLGEKAYTRKPLSPAQAEKELKAVDKSLDSELFTKESSGANLVPASDPRPALAASAADEFTCGGDDD